MRKKAVIAIVLGCMLFLSLGGEAYAFDIPSPTPPPPSTPFDDELWVYYAEDEYMHWGPAVYYEQPVLVHYAGPARAYFVSTINHFLYWTYGKAKIYEAIYDESGSPTAGSLIDEKPFWGIVAYIDSLNDWGWPARVWPGLMPGYVESFNCKWCIWGIYDFTANCQNGDWRVESVTHTSPPVTGGMFPDEPPYEGYFPPQ